MTDELERDLLEAVKAALDAPPERPKEAPTDFTRELLELSLIYEEAGAPLPSPANFALLLLEGTVELAMAAGNSPKDAHKAVSASMRRIQVREIKSGRRLLAYDEPRPATLSRLAEEIAGVAVLLACVKNTAGISSEEIKAAAREKVRQLKREPKG